MKRKLMILCCFITIFTMLNTIAYGVDDMEVRFKSGVYENKEWNEEMLSYTGNIITSKEAAIDIAATIFRNMPGRSKEMGNYKPRSVFYDEPDEIWIVGFSETDDIWVDGGVIRIAIRQANGEVLRIWIEE